MHIKFSIVDISRILKSSSDDKADENDLIHFKGRVNLLVGGPNTGKTTWLQCLNYLLGSENPVDHYFTQEFVEKYKAICGNFIINSKPCYIKRDWTILKKKTKIYLNGHYYSSEQFQVKLMQYLGIDCINYPKPDPISSVRATFLSFRMHFRHLYRQQKYWCDLVDKQPASEFRSCLLNFLGVAKKIYTNDYYKFYELSDNLRHENQQYTSKKDALAIILPIISSFTEIKPKEIDLFDKISYVKKSLLAKIESQPCSEQNNENCQSSENINDSSYDHEFNKDCIDRSILKERLRIISLIEPIVADAMIHSRKVLDLTADIQHYYSEIRNMGINLGIESRLDALCDGMQEYLTALNRIRPNIWRHEKISMILNRNYLNVRINYKPWQSVLGGTDTLYFLLAYHYGLLVMSSHEESQIPGLMVIDLPPDIDGDKNIDDQGFVIQPFINLLKNNKYNHCQVIFTGHNFDKVLPKKNELLLSYENDFCYEIKMKNEYLSK